MNGEKFSATAFHSLGNNMTCIVINQKSEDAVASGTAFRFAYNRAKTWKAWIWGITFAFALIQTASSAYSFSDWTLLSFDTTPYVVGFLLASVIAGSLGKMKVMEWQSMGCTLQRLHDFLVMQVGSKPSHLELPKATINALSEKRLAKYPGDKYQLETWWASSLTDVSFPVAKLVSAYSTFSWECELRKRYQTLLNIILVLSIAMPITLALCLQYTVVQTIIFTLAPFTPFISVVLDEWFANKKSLAVAEKLNIECHTTWENILENRLLDNDIDVKTEQYMSLWQSFRLSATPIFEWLYNFSRKSMEKDMIINTESLVQELNTRK